MKHRLIVVCLIIVLMLTACAGQMGTRGLNDTVRPNNNDESVRMLESGQTLLPTITLDGISYVDMDNMAGLMGFQTSWSEDGTRFQIGDIDVIWTFQSDSRTAVEEEVEKLMDAPARKQQGTMLVPTAALKELFTDEAVISVDQDQVSIFPTPQVPSDNEDEEFMDDPEEDASKEPELEASAYIRDSEADQSLEIGVLSKSQSDQLISNAKKYLGVPYKFGAGPYASSKRFDCSSYVRFLYAKFGYELPRTARAQANKGKLVPKSKLREGDLLFFYVPGRFKSNKKVGHVGIYMGNKKMIHSGPWPKDGVQISDINTGHWKKTFLYAKRLM